MHFGSITLTSNDSVVTVGNISTYKMKNAYGISNSTNRYMFTSCTINGQGNINVGVRSSTSWPGNVQVNYIVVGDHS